MCRSILNSAISAAASRAKGIKAYAARAFWRSVAIRRVLRWLDIAGGLLIQATWGARLVGVLVPASRPVLCSACFSDLGLRFEAERFGIPHALRCPNCGAKETRKLTPFLMRIVAGQFFVRGSVSRSEYGGAPLVQFNEAQFGKGDYIGSGPLEGDIRLISEKAKIGLFYYGPRMWMIGQVTPLLMLIDSSSRPSIIRRIITEYPKHLFKEKQIIYRLRIAPSHPSDPAEYDSPPSKFLGKGRLDSVDNPVLYCSQDIEGCVHECRVTVEDELYLASLQATRDLRFLDLTAVLQETNVTEFESLDMAIHMLFFAASHSYEISRDIAKAVSQAGFDGLVYPSYFSQVRSGAMPFETAYGLSVRRFPDASRYAKGSVFSNAAIFGRPIDDGRLRVVGINRVVLHKVSYDIRFGPVRSR